MLTMVLCTRALYLVMNLEVTIFNILDSQRGVQRTVTAEIYPKYHRLAGYFSDVVATICIWTTRFASKPSIDSIDFGNLWGQARHIN